MTERIAYDGAQEEPEEHEPHADQSEERTEPKEEFYHGKNIVEKCQNQVLNSFAFAWRTDVRVQTSRRFVDMADRLPRSTDNAVVQPPPQCTTAAGGSIVP